MAKRDPTETAIARLAALRAEGDPAALAEALPTLLADKAGYVVGRAAELAAERQVRTALAAILAAFERLLKAATSKDVGCTAKAALARAIVKLEAGYEAEALLLVGRSHAHWEAVWGGQADLAVGVRGQSVIGLAAMGSRLALNAASELLAEPDSRPPRERVSWPARADAARALTMIGSDGAAAVLRFKALLGDPEPTVVSECLAGVIAIDGDDGLTLAERFLQRDDETTDAALLAIGGSRRPGAFTLLRRHADVLLLGEHRQTFVSAVALTRQEAAIDYLFDLLATADRATSEAAAEALEPLRGLQRIGERLDATRRTR